MYGLVLAASLFSFSTFSQALEQPSAKDCEHALESKLPAIAKSLVANDDGTLTLKIDYTYKEQGLRELILPSALSWIRSQGNLKAIVLAGNSGVHDDRGGLVPIPFLDTYHSLGFVFGDYLARTLPLVSTIDGRSQPFHERVQTRVSYDDQTEREWLADFQTQAPYFRTTSGEIFFYPQVDGNNWVVIKMIGDYNETGDFAVPILDILGIHARDTVLVNDNVKVPEAEIFYENELPAKFSGNNAEFSMMRTLAYSAIDHAATSLTRLPLEIDTNAFIEKMQVNTNFRDASYVDQKLHDRMIKTSTALENNVRGWMKANVRNSFIDTKALNQTQALRVRSKELGQDVGDATKEAAQNPQSKDLAQKLENLINERSAVAKQLRAEKAKIEAEYDSIVGEVTGLIHQEMALKHLAIGSGKEGLEKGAFADHVLSPFPKDKYNDDFFAQVLAKLREVLAGAPAN
jgi:hypothetical protein